MLDRYNRKINYLRISVTDRCNYRCVYCMPAEEVRWLPRECILSFEEIFDVTQTAVAMGIDKVRLTGGEPLFRESIVDLVSMLAGIEGIRDFALTTNGTLLADYAKPLAKAGLHRVNISLDTLSPERYTNMTRGGDIMLVLAGIESAQSAGLAPIKLNCVVEQSSQEPDAIEVARFAKANGLQVRFIRRMNITSGEFWPIEGGTGGDCKLCNRLRLSCDGMVSPCLFSDLAFSVRELGPAEAIRQAVAAKPESGKHSTSNTFYNIGG